jgi:shikimate dehydrogenase
MSEPRPLKRRLVGLIGSHIGGSLAPALHEDAFAAAGMVGHYHLMDVAQLPGRRLGDLLEAARTAGFAGLNITHPFKEAVLGLLNSVAPDAGRIGAVNTVVFDKEGCSIGHNTDSSGFRRAFTEAFGQPAARAADVLQLGAGGAGRAVAFALAELGVGHLALFDRDAKRSADLAAALGRHFGAGRCTVVADPEAAAASVAGIVNATPVGMTGYAGVPLPLQCLKAAHFVADVIYTPIDTELVQAARRLGCRTMNGGGMCVHQAADAFRHFTGISPDIARMQRTFDAALERRDLVTAAE